ncbi:efflux RND transporter periplasmic adaptor subunit [uncultured Sphingomonas sp.]|uniref:efflux RND transporter periplasmic adaptor subunit n=1 Tax=uncultured Sphingomonas sp. TaxID=158754 RepID=UPI0035CA4137
MASSNQAELDDFLGGRPPSRTRRYVTWAAIAIGVVVLILLLMRIFGGTAPAGYASEPAARGDLTVTVSATGKLAPTNQVDVGSELSGLVTRVVVDVNDRVTKGQPLALIDPSRFQDTVNQSQAALNANIAQVSQAQATLAQSSATLARYQEVSRLSGGRVPAKTELEQAIADRDRAVANLRSAQANVVSARATLSSNSTQLTKTIIRSPVNGVVLARQIEPGATVAASFNTPTLFVIAEDLSAMKLEVAIDEADVGTVKTGQRATFTVDAFPGKTFPATITRVDLGSNLSAQSSTTTTTTTAQVVSYGATLSVANTDLNLRPGMTATADIVTSERKKVLMVPNAALRFRPADAGAPAAAASGSGGFASALTPRRLGRQSGTGGNAAPIERGSKQAVYVKQADATLKRISVTTGETNGSMTEITGGDLKPGMEVVTGQLSATATGSGARRRTTGAAGGGSGGQRGGQ